MPAILRKLSQKFDIHARRRRRRHPSPSQGPSPSATPHNPSITADMGTGMGMESLGKQSGMRDFEETYGEDLGRLVRESGYFADSERHKRRTNKGEKGQGKEGERNESVIQAQESLPRAKRGRAKALVDRLAPHAARHTDSQAMQEDIVEDEHERVYEPRGYMKWNNTTEPRPLFDKLNPGQPSASRRTAESDYADKHERLKVLLANTDPRLQLHKCEGLGEDVGGEGREHKLKVVHAKAGEATEFKDNPEQAIRGRDREVMPYKTSNSSDSNAMITPRLSTSSKPPSRPSSRATPAEQHIATTHLGASPRATLLFNNHQWCNSIAPATFSLDQPTPTPTDHIDTTEQKLALITNGHSSTSTYTPHYPSPLSYEGLTWNLALRGIISSDAIQPETREAIQCRLNNRISVDIISPADIGLVPNFSYPIAAAPFYDQYSALGIVSEYGEEDWGREQVEYDSSFYCQTPDTPNGIIPELEEIERIVNGIHTSARPSVPEPLDTPVYISHSSSPNHVSRLSTTPSAHPLIHEYDYESTITTLQSEISALRARNYELEEDIVPSLTDSIERQSMTIDSNLSIIDALREEIVDLKIAVDFGNKVLGGCWAREWATLSTINEIRGRNKNRNGRQRGRVGLGGGAGGLLRTLFRNKGPGKGVGDEALTSGQLPKGYEWEVFGQGPNPSGSEDVVGYLTTGDTSRNSSSSKGSRRETPTSSNPSLFLFLSRSEIDALADMAEQNLCILKEDVEEMVGLIQGCKNWCTGIQDVEEHPQGSWRDV
ncbi:hypothetical protein K505DRAFT_342335 [Melanomma pulvis-pyrius CBS 109.77]|uniref:Uncharacterized protein n=1 Tax=Melanomma pulvis-pyrius CBS 109.77 TaxID=1314802 RepID=A0A6A6WW50_9PLEO|nr:hypothetical protein K505DRAFT_342335 [Melanomma pulvis-pyrius CBS 109.77]